MHSGADWELWRKAFAIRLDSMEKRLDENTAMTCEIKRDTSELVTAFKAAQGAGKVAKFISKPIAWLVTVGGGIAASYAAWKSAGR